MGGCKSDSLVILQSITKWTACRLDRNEDPKTYFVRLHDECSAQSRLEDILGSETRNSIAKHNLIEIVRTDKNRQPLHDKTLKGGPIGTIGVLPPIEFGRLKIEEEIKTAAAQKLAGFGIAEFDFPDQE